MDLIRAFGDLDATITNVYTMEKQSLASGKLTQKFWSSHSLPLYRGGTANRFNNTEFDKLENWDQRHSIYLENPIQKFLSNGIAHELSPIEKYELLIDSHNFPLTFNEWAKGKEYINEAGYIPHWVGACHGTAPSSISHPRPTRSISVLSADGKTSVIFYPSDLKALLAHIWTTNGGPSAVMGSRCSLFKGKMNKDCRDSNPGSFHLALTNLIGIHKKPLIIDTDSGAQVWNRPVVSYQFSYFNPQFRNYTRKISNAIIDRAKYHNDPYKQSRAAGAKKIVGVRSEIEVIDDTTPNAEHNDSNSNDKSFKIVYTYDLELDQDGKILGGMWHQPNFPDFVWVVTPENLPLSRSERSVEKPIIIDSFEDVQLPTLLKEIAIESRKTDQLSYWVIDYLLRLSTVDESFPLVQ